MVKKRKKKENEKKTEKAENEAIPGIVPYERKDEARGQEQLYSE